MRAALTVAAWVLGIATFFLLSIGYDRVAQLSADVAVERTGVWAFNPHVGPGDDLHLEVKSTGGVKLGIRQVRVSGAGQPVYATGRGQHWGFSFRSSSRSSGEDSVDLVVPVPAEHPTGTSLDLQIAVETVTAQRRSRGFRNHPETVELALRIPVRSTVARGGMRLVSLLRALLCFAALVWLLLRAGPALGRYDERTDSTEAETEGVAYLMLALCAVVAALGYPIFARPMIAATGLVSPWLTVFWMVLWIIGPPLVAYRLHRRRRDAAQATLRVLQPSGVPLAALLRPLAQVTGQVRHRGRVISVKRARKAWVQLRFADDGLARADVRYEGPSSLLIQVAAAVAEAAGTVELADRFARVEIPRSPDRARVQADWDAQTQAALDRLLQQARELLARMDQLKP